MTPNATPDETRNQLTRASCTRVQDLLEECADARRIMLFIFIPIFILLGIGLMIGPIATLLGLR